MVSIDQTMVEVREGEPVEIRCTATGNPTPTLSWNSASGANLNHDVTFYDGIFYIPQARLSDAGNYVCIATNEAGQDSREVRLHVISRGWFFK